VDLVESQLADCEVCVVWIGREWLTVQDEGGRRRLENPNDLVRREVATSLRRRIAIPVLVGALPPRREELPDELQPLADIDAIEIRHTRFDDDLEVLVDYLEQRVTRSPWVPALAMVLSWMVPAAYYGPFFVGPAGEDELFARSSRSLTPFLIHGLSVAVGMIVAVWWMRRDVSRILLGLLGVVWIVAWAGVVFAVTRIDYAYFYPISAFPRGIVEWGHDHHFPASPGGIYLVAIVIGGLGATMLLRSFGRLTDWKWLAAIILPWSGVAFAISQADDYPDGIYLVAILIGLVGGLGTSAALRWYRRLTEWRWLVAIALAWPVGCGLSAALINGAARIWELDPNANRPLFDFANALAGGVAGGIGVAVLTLALYRASPLTTTAKVEGGRQSRAISPGTL
jgi:hypothetical protein